MFWKKIIGDKSFYKKVLAVSVPIMIQSGFTTFVNLLDNIMVGRLGTEAMSGVSIVNQFFLIFNLVIFGAVSAAGIFTAQFHGKNDLEGVRETFRFKVLVNIIASCAAILIFALLDDFLISTFLHASDTEGDLALTLKLGKDYLFVMLIGMIPYSLTQVYASTMRETEHTVLPMVASICAVLTNFVFNCILIFGLLGMPALGVTGAAISTVISRFVELLILVFFGHTQKRSYPFFVGAYKKLIIRKELFSKIAVKGLPLIANEFLWSLAFTMRNQCYSTAGLDVVAAQNISGTIFNFLNVFYMAIGTSISIIVGNLLGAGKFEEAKDTDRKMLAFSVMISLGITFTVIPTSNLFPMIYKTSDSVRELASYMMIVSALYAPFFAYAHAAYFTLRSGGKVFITMVFDSIYMWILVIPLSYLLAYFTNTGIHAMFAICHGTEMIKALFGYVLIKKGTWAHRLVDEKNRLNS